MSKVSQLLVLLLANIVISCGKSTNPLKRDRHLHKSKQRLTGSKQVSDNEAYYRRREVRPIEPGYSPQADWTKDNRKKSSSSKRASKRCFCGPAASVCPQGFTKTEIDWPCPSEPFVPPHYQPNGPPYEVGDDWTWLEDNYEGDLEKNVYGWNWKGKQKGNSPTAGGYTFDGYPCGQNGWCCCEDGKQNDQPTVNKKPPKHAPHHKQRNSDRVIINII